MVRVFLDGLSWSPDLRLEWGLSKLTVFDDLSVFKVILTSISPSTLAFLCMK
jgi:hypothetical protein